VVFEVGSGVDPAWHGRRVIVNPALHWGASERSQDFSSFEILGLPTDGTFAQYVKVPAENVFDRPDYLSDDEAAAIPLAALTAYRAVATRGGLGTGESVLITGVGSGTAVFALQISTAIGGKVYVTSSKPAKIERAKEMGALGGVDYREQGWAGKLKDAAGGFDLIVDSAGGEGFSDLIDLANPGGRIVFFGATAGTPSKFESRKVFWKQLSILGTTMGSPQEFAAMLELFVTHQIRPLVDKVFPLEHANDAVDALEESDRMGKIVLKVQE